MHQRTHNEAEPRPPHQKLQSLKIINFYCNILQFDILRPKNNNLANMRRIITVVSVAIIIQSLQAQEARSPVTTAPSPIAADSSPTAPPASAITFESGYFGETITRPGAIVAVQKPISKTNGLHHIRLNIAFYKHPGYNNNLVVLPEYLFRKTKKKGRFFEAAAGGGWMYQKPDRMIILYDNGSFTETNRGWSYIAPTILLGGGKKIQKGALKETAFSVGLRWFGQYPFNGFLMHHFALEGRVAIPGYLFNKQ